MATPSATRTRTRRRPVPAAPPAPAASHWTFLSNHAHVLVSLARDPEARLRDVAAGVGITERGVQKILRDLADAGVLTRERIGRRNRYQINRRVPLRHSLEAHETVGTLLRLVGGE